MARPPVPTAVEVVDRSWGRWLVRLSPAFGLLHFLIRFQVDGLGVWAAIVNGVLGFATLAVVGVGQFTPPVRFEEARARLIDPPTSGWARVRLRWRPDGSRRNTSA